MSENLSEEALSQVNWFSRSPDERMAEAERRIAVCRDAGGRELDLSGLWLRGVPDGLAELTSLTKLDLSYNAIGPEGAAHLAGLTSLTELDLSHNAIGSEGAAHLAGLTSLTELDLSSNAIGSEGAAHLAGLTSLTELGLSSNRIGPEGVAYLAGLTSLRELSLSKNGIGAEGAAHLAGLASLTVLNLSNNRIGSEGAAHLAGLTSLTDLNLFDNRVGARGAAHLARLTSLKNLNLSGSEIGAAGAAHLAELTSLTELNLSSNSIGSDGVAHLAGLTSLTELNLFGNRIGPEGMAHLAGLTSLTELNLFGNAIGPEGAVHLAGLTSLTELNLSGNGIGSEGVMHLAGLTSLTMLDLTSNEIGGEGAAHLGGLMSLQDLNLSGNRIGSEGVAHLAGLSSLAVLDLSSNGIGPDGAAHLAELTSLLSVDLSNNQIARISPFANLRRLQLIVLDGNPIEEVCPEVWRLQTLRHVSASSVGWVPREVLSSNAYDNCLDGLRRYLDDMERGPPRELRDVKVMILGNGQIGKTQMRNRLVDGKYIEGESSTHGVKISEIDLPAGSGGAPRFLDGLMGRKREITPLKIWDFGGQDIYLGTHALFMRTRAIFPLVWTPQSSEAAEHEVGGQRFRNFPLRWWADYIRTMGGEESPVLLVQAQCDEAGMGKDPPLAPGQREAFAFRPPEIPYSAKYKLGHDRLLDALREAVDWLKTRRGVVRIGPGWAAVKTHIEALQADDRKRAPIARKHRTMTFAGFLAICGREAKITEAAEARVLLRFLHDLGVLFHQADVFNDLIILDQQWALDAIYAVFDRASGAHRDIEDLQGRFTRSQLGRRVWSKFSEKEQDVFISMMKACSVCFTLRRASEAAGEALYIAPDLLPTRARLEPKLTHTWDADRETMEAVYRFDFLPQTLLRGVMAEVGEKAGEDADYWREGFRFWDATGAQARVEEIRGDARSGAGEIRVRTQKGDAAGLLEKLCRIMDRACKRLGIEAREKPEAEPDERVSPRAREARTDNPKQDVPALKVAAEPSVKDECFISYAHADGGPMDAARDEPFGRVKAHLRTLDLEPAFDIERLPFGESISRFMKRMAKSPRAVVILSEKYLRSPYCMYELMALWSHAGLDERVFQSRVRAVTLPDAKIWSLGERYAIQTAWEKQLAETAEIVKHEAEKGKALHPRDHEDFWYMQRFASDTAGLLRVVADTLHPTRLEDIDKLIF